MSRYARLERVGDASGDEREDLRAAMASERVDDPQGDRVELVRARLSRQGRFATREAFLARRRGSESDSVERRLARLTLARAKADFRRHMLIKADELAELKQYNADKLRFADPYDRIGIADERFNEERLNRQKETEQRREDSTNRGDNDDEGRGRYEGALIRDAREFGDEAKDLRDLERLESKTEREDDKAAAREEKTAEKADEKEAEKTERADERSAENAEERNDDRREEKTIRQTEESARDDS